MRIPLSWINQFTPLPKLKIQELARRFTLGACEVEAILCEKDLWSQVQLVEVQRIEPHTENLLCPIISNGTEEIRLVCGAKNLYPGLKTLWAAEGTEMPTGTLKNRKIMGVLSRGMLCSEQELGLSDDHNGVIDLTELAAGQSLGMSFADLLARCLEFGEPLKLGKNKILTPEFILDIDNKSITHRPDMWGIYGVAREFGALFPECNMPNPYGKSRFQAYEKKEAPHNKAPFQISIDKDSSCLSYCALAIDGVQVGESPDWMQNRLKMSGIKVINSIVDVSNYLMLERGAPNHIFDRDRLAGEQICVYKLEREQNFTTLDGQLRQLQVGDTVVADSQKPQVIAGIMGGDESSVRDSTQNILLELAVWDSYETRKTSMRLGLRTDSSLRYEKSLDPFSIEENLLRLCQLILECHPTAQVRGGLQSYYKNKPKDIRIKTSATKIAQVLGHPLDNPQGCQLITQIFSNLGFSVKSENEDEILVQVPSFRTSKDIALEEDLIEEIGRIIGFDNIVPRAPLTEIQPISLGTDQQLARKIRNFLVLNGNAQEVLSYPLIGEKLLEQCRWKDKNEALILVNPLNPEQDRMRPSMIPSHLELVARNNNAHKFPQFCLFELGRSYQKDREEQQLLISSYSEDDNPILELRSTCERLLGYLFGKQIDHREWQHECLELRDWPGLHPTEYSTWCQGSETCTIFSLHPALLRNFKLRGKLAMALIPLGPVTLPKEQTKAHKASQLCFVPPSRFPSVAFDCTIALPPRVFAAEAVHTLEQQMQGATLLGTYLKSVSVRSTYQDQTRWLTLQCIFASHDKTLESQEITELTNQVLQTLEKAGFPLKTETLNE